MRYVTYDNSGNLTGCYLQEVHPDHQSSYIEVGEDIAVGWPAYRANAARDGVELAPVVSMPEPSVPLFVPKLNGRLAMIEAGVWEDVQSFVAEQGPIAVAYLEDAQTIRRDNQLVNAWAAARGKSVSEVDALFARAAEIET